ncbi:glycosyltransferase family 39 protein [bacterium]|nr:glycosyltransferase family 39 protein [bacterium]
MRTRRFYVLLFLWLIFAFLITSNLPLHYDEAYYWVLSNNLALGYYDHPPLNMYLIRLSYTLFGNSEFSVRLTSILFQLTSICLIYHYLIGLTQNRKVSFWWTVIYSLIPLALFWGGLGMNGDAGVITFSILSTMLFKKAISEENLRYWIYFGISCGLGALTKFTFLTLLPGLFLYLVFNKDRRRFLWRKEIYLSILVTFLLFTPFLIWNFNNGFPTFFFNLVARHHPYNFTWWNFWNTIQLLLLCLGPVTLILSLLYVIQVLRKQKLNESDIDPAFFIQLTLIPLFMYIGSGSVMKWHYMIVLCFPVTVNSLLLFYNQTRNSVYYTNQSSKKIGIYAAACIFMTTLMTLLVIGAFIKFFQEPKLVFSKNYSLEENKDPDNSILNRDAVTYYGTSKAGNYLDELQQGLKAKGYNDLFIVAKDYREASQLSFYTPSHPEIFLLGFKEIFGRNYIFYRQRSESRLLGKNAIYVTQYPSSLIKIKGFFQKVEKLDPFFIKDDKGHVIRIFYFYLCFEYLGDDTGILDVE